MSPRRHRKAVFARGQVTAQVASWAHPFAQGMTALLRQAIGEGSLRVWGLSGLLISLLVLLISLIG